MKINLKETRLSISFKARAAVAEMLEYKYSCLDEDIVRTQGYLDETDKECTWQIDSYNDEIANLREQQSIIAELLQKL